MKRRLSSELLSPIWLVLALAALSGCTEVSVPEPDASVSDGSSAPLDDDGGQTDAGQADASVRDGSDEHDADIGEPDADIGEPDADIGEPDAGDLDADTEEPDASEPDATIVHIAPTASFTCSPSGGAAPLTVTLTSTATPGDSPITHVEYDFGAGFGTATSKTFETPGSYIILQRVRDENGLTDTASFSLVVQEPPFINTLWSLTDKRPEVIVSASQLTLEIETIGTAGVRSTTSMAPFSGVHYFEASIPEPFDGMTIGVATAQQDLTKLAGETDQSFGLNTGGQIYFNGAYLAGFRGNANKRYGFIVDYRDAIPSVRIITIGWSGGPEVSSPFTLGEVHEPLFVYAAGMRRTKEEQLTLHPGNDLTNDPFVFDPVALLESVDPEAAQVLELGVRGTNHLPHNEPPELHGVPFATSLALGASMEFSATAFDAESGDLSASIVWEDLGTGLGGDALRHVGPNFTLTPNTLGIHPIRVTVTDALGKRARTTFDVEVGGPLPSYSDVHLVTEPGLTGSGITVSPDGYSVHYTLDKKMGIRANQALYGDFWYFEATRHVGNENIGVGLVIGNVSLDPYPFNTTPPSCSLNSASGVWRDLMFQGGYDVTAQTYGFAVDYRGRYPIAYVIAKDTIATIHLTDATVPVYPMLYGNVTSGIGSEGPVPYEMTLNVGQSPFVYDARALLQAKGVADAESIRLCWGLDNAACP